METTEMSINRLMDKEAVIQPIIQSKVSQKEKNNYCTLMYVYGIYKDGTDEPICRAAVETQT